MRLVDFIVAEDIRQEAGNKHSIMGVFADAMTISVKAALPASVALRCSVFLRFEVTPQDPEVFDFRLEARWQETQASLGEIAGIAHRGAAQTALFTLPLNFPFLTISGSGRILFRVTCKAGDQVVFDEDLRPLQVTVNTVP